MMTSETTGLRVLYPTKSRIGQFGGQTCRLPVPWDMGEQASNSDEVSRLNFW